MMRFFRKLRGTSKREAEAEKLARELSGGTAVKGAIPRAR